MSQARFHYLQKEFTSLFFKQLKKKGKANILPNQQKQLERIIYIVNMQILKQWAAKVVTVYDQDQKKKKQKMKGVKNFFSGFGGLFGGGNKKKKQEQEKKKKQEQERKKKEQQQKKLQHSASLQEDQQNIQKILKQLDDQNLYADSYAASSNSESIKIQAEFQLQEASVILEMQRMHNQYEQSEGIRFWMKNIQFTGQQKENKSRELHLTTQDIGLELYSFQHNSDSKMIKNQTKQKIIYKQSEEIKNIFQLQFKRSKQNDLQFQITLNPIVLVFQQLLLHRLIQFMYIPNLPLSDDAYDQILQIKEGTQDKVQDTFYGKNNKIIVKVLSPTLLVPFQRNNDQNSPTWCINLGDITVTNVTDFMKVADLLDRQTYEPFNLDIQRFGLQFFQTLKFARQFNSKRKMSQIQSGSQIEIKKQQIQKSTTLLRQTSGFDVIQPFSLNLLLGVRKKAVKQVKKTKIILNGQMSQIIVNVTPQLYNDLINIDYCFKVDGNQTQEQLLGSKNEIVQAAIKISQLKRRSKFRTWSSTFTILSGGYIYFYDKTTDVSVSSYFFLRDCQIEKKLIRNDSGGSYELHLVNKFNDECDIAFGTKDEMEEWQNLIIARIIEMSPNKHRTFMKIENSSNDDVKKEQQKQKNKDAKNKAKQQQQIEEKVLKFDFSVPQVKLNILDASLSSWVDLSLKQFQSTLEVRQGDFLLEFQLQSLLARDLNNSKFSQVISSETVKNNRVNKPLVEFKLSHISKSAVNYQDVDFKIDVQIGNVNANFNPPIIHQCIVYVSNIQANKLRYHRRDNDELIWLMNEEGEEEEQKAAAGKDPKFASNIISQLKKIKQVEKDKKNEPFNNKMDIQVTFKEITVLLINSQYNTPFVMLQMGETSFEYYRKIDHQQVNGRFGNVNLIDKTNWPRTKNPARQQKQDRRDNKFWIQDQGVDGDDDEDDDDASLILQQNSQDEKESDLMKEQQLEILGPREFQNETDPQCVLSFNLKLLKNICPMKRQGIKNICNVQLNAFQVVYFQELTFRLIDYFMDQFLEAISTQLQSTKKQDVQQNIKPQQQILLAKLKTQNQGYQEVYKMQQEQRTSVSVIIDRPLIILKPRPWSETSLQLELGKIRLENDFVALPNRWQHNMLAKILVSQFRIDAQNMYLRWSEERQPLSEPFDMHLVFEKVAFQRFISHCIPFNLLDQSNKFQINFSPIVLNIEQAQFTFIMNCVDLNINYEDGLKQYFNFAITRPIDEQMPHQIKMRVFVSAPSISLKLYKKRREKIGNIMVDLSQDVPQSIAELSLIGFDLKVIKEICGRADINLDLRTMFILFEQKSIPITARELLTSAQSIGSLRRLVCGPLKSPIYIRTNKQFYQRASQKFIKKQIAIHVMREPNGDKTIQANISKLKIFLIPHIFIAVFDFFVNGLPVYAQDSDDKPNLFDPDPQNASKLVVSSNIVQSLVCANQQVTTKAKTIAFQGDIIFFYARQTIRKVKQILLQQYQSDFEVSRSLHQKKRSEGSLSKFQVVGDNLSLSDKIERKNKLTQSSINGKGRIKRSNIGSLDSKSPSKLQGNNNMNQQLSQMINQMKVNILNLSCFECKMTDLDGKSFKQVRKRRIVHPFPVFYNSKQMLCLTAPDKTFKAYNKKQVDLQKTIVKLSFMDFIIIYRVMFYNLNLMKIQFQNQNIEDRLEIQVDPQILDQNSEIDDISIASSSTYLQNASNAFNNTNQSSSGAISQQLQTIKQAKSIFTKLKDKVEKRIQIFQPKIKQGFHKKSGKSFSRRGGLTLKQSVIDQKVEYKLGIDDDDEFGEHNHPSLYLQKSGDKTLSFDQHGKSNIGENQDRKVKVIRSKTMLDEGNTSMNIQEQSKDANNVSFTVAAAPKKRRNTDAISPLQFKGKKLIDEKQKNILRHKNSSMLAAGYRGQQRVSIAPPEKPKIVFERMNDQFELVTHSLQLILINDHDNQFCPVLQFNFSQFQYIYQALSGSNTKLSFQSYYYNPQHSLWEPFIQNMLLQFIMVNAAEERSIILKSPGNININISLMLCQNLINAKESWEQAYYQFTEDMEQQQSASPPRKQNYLRNQLQRKMINNTDKKIDSRLSIRSNEEIQICDEQQQRKQITALSQYKKAATLFNQKNKSQDQNYLSETGQIQLSKLKTTVIHEFQSNSSSNSPETNNRKSMIEQSQYEEFKLTDKQFIQPLSSPGERLAQLQQKTTQDTVSPYVLENYSGFRIYVHKLINQGDNLKDGVVQPINQYVVESGKSVQIEIDYQSRISGQLWRNQYDPFSRGKNQDSVKVIIDSTKPYQPIQKISFGSVGNFTHNLQDGKSQIPMGSLEYLIYQIELRKMRKIICIRTPYIFQNQTQFTYLIRFSKNVQPCSFRVHRLRPGQLMPLPISEVNCLISIAIQQSSHDGSENEYTPSKSFQSRQSSFQSKFNEIEWSDQFRMAQFQTVKNEAYLSLAHGNRYTYINKQIKHSKAVNFVIVSPIMIVNALPCKLDICIPRDDNSVYSLNTKQSKYINQYSFGEKIPIMITIDGFAWSQHIIKANDKPRSGEDIKIQLKQQAQQKKKPANNELKPIENQTKLALYLHVLSGKAGKRFIVYSRNIIINKTDQNLMFYYHKQSANKLQPAAGQNVQSRRNVILLSDREKLRCKLGTRVSEMFTIAGSGVAGEFSIKCDQGGTDLRLYEFAYKTSISLVLETEFIYSKIITIVPKYVIINQMTTPLHIMQADQYGCIEEMLPKERKPFYWFSADKEKIIRARSTNAFSNRSPSKQFQNQETEQEKDERIWSQHWAFSNPFLLQQMGIISVINRHQRFKNAAKYLRVERRKIDEIIYVIIDQESDEHPVFLFENLCFNISILYKQKGCEDCDHLAPRSSTLFAWQDLATPKHKILELCFLIGDLHGRPVFIDMTRLEINLNEIDTQHEVKIPTNLYQSGRKVFISLTTDGYTRFVRFYTLEADNTVRQHQVATTPNQEKVEKVKFSFGVQIQDIAFSFIMKNPANNRRVQIALLHLSDLHGLIIDTTDEVRKMQFRIGYLQIDNMGTFKTIYPVILRPKYIQRKANGQAYSHAFLDVSTDINLKNKKVHHIMRFEFLLQTLLIRMEDEFLNSVLQFGSNLFSELNTTFTKVHPIFKDKGITQQSLKSKMYNQQLLQHSREHHKLPMIAGDSGSDIKNPNGLDLAPWKSVDTSRNSKMIYIAKLSVSPLDLQLSFLSKSVNKFGNQALRGISSAFGVTFKNFQNASIRLNHIETNNVFGSTPDILHEIYELYKQRFLRNIFFIIGSIDILGNPINLFNSIGTGFKDFFFKPAQGFVKGPLQGGFGILKGTGSLMKHSVQGAFGTTSKIANSMSKGLLTLMNDEQFINSRQRKEVTEKPKHVVDGFGYGLKSVFTSIGSGIVGIVAQPVKGAKKKGAQGFFSGALKGIAGVVVKPITGGLDLVSKTSEGIKNTAGILDKVQLDKRIRYPRCFYGSGDIIRPYDENDTLVIAYLDRVKKGLFLLDHFIESYIYEVRHRYFMLLMTIEHVALIDTNQIHVIWYIHTNSMVFVQQQANGLEILLKGKDGKVNKAELEMDPEDQQGITYLRQRITNLIQQEN